MKVQKAMDSSKKKCTLRYFTVSAVLLQFAAVVTGFFLTVMAWVLCWFSYDAPLALCLAHFMVDGTKHVYQSWVLRMPARVETPKMTCSSCTCGSNCHCCSTGSVNLYSTEDYCLAALLSLGLVAGLGTLAFGRHHKLVLAPNGISFPVSMWNTLLFRRKRQWTDINQALFRDYMDDPEEETYKAKEVVLGFRSGGFAPIQLKRFAKEKDVHKFLQALRAWTNQSILSSELLGYIAQVLDQAPSQAFTPKENVAKELSYTNMWEEELHTQLGATTYVPLEKGATVLSGRIRVISHIASGGLSAVYLAEDQRQDLVVLKEAVVPQHVDERTKSKAKELFEREAHILLKLSHPRIAKVLDHFVDAGRDYLILEYVPGHSLKQLVKRKGPQNEEKVLLWASEMAGILGYLHGLSPPLIHRDITPDNLILKDDGTINLIDFGAANEYIGAATGTLIGKQSYIAPEQFRGKAEPASDIYSLGGTLYFLLTGHDPEALSTSHPSVTNCEVSAAMDALVAACTELEPDLRVSSAKVLQKRIDQMIRSSGAQLAGTKGNG